MYFFEEIVVDLYCTIGTSPVVIKFVFLTFTL